MQILLQNAGQVEILSSWSQIESNDCLVCVFHMGGKQLKSSTGQTKTTWAHFEPHNNTWHELYLLSFMGPGNHKQFQYQNRKKRPLPQGGNITNSCNKRYTFIILL